MDALEKHLYINTLFHLYGPLLTNKQQSVMQYYYLDNYTLAEIADIQNVSRNAVYDQLQHAVEKLKDFETKLKLNEKQNKRQQLLKRLESYSNDETILNIVAKIKDVE